MERRLAARLVNLCKARGLTVVTAESCTGGLLAERLTRIGGSSAYFLGGAVVYTAKARMALMDLPREAVAGMRSASPPYALLLARTARENLAHLFDDGGFSEYGALAVAAQRRRRGCHQV